MAYPSFSCSAVSACVWRAGPESCSYSTRGGIYSQEVFKMGALVSFFFLSPRPAAHFVSYGKNPLPKAPRGGVEAPSEHSLSRIHHQRFRRRTSRYGATLAPSCFLVLIPVLFPTFLPEPHGYRWYLCSPVHTGIEHMAPVVNSTL